MCPVKYTLNDPALKHRRRELRRNQTEAERVFWSRVREEKCAGIRFFRQYSVGPYILDYYCPAVKLGVELDGGQHNELDKVEYDEARSEYLKALGIDILRFWNNEVLQNMDGVLERIHQYSLLHSVTSKEITPSVPLNLRGKGE